MLERLIKRAEKKGAKFILKYDPSDNPKDVWGLKFFPDPEDDGHYWSFGDTLEAVVKEVMDEMDGFK